jgi:diacylglycerol kinase
MSKRNSMLKSFGYAGNGIREAFKTEPNFRIHTIAAVISIILAFYFQFSLIKFAILILTITLVIILELVNTAIEKVVDKISPTYSRLAKVAKDVSAAAVLISAFAAILVGLLLFGPYIAQLLSSATH